MNFKIHSATIPNNKEWPIPVKVLFRIDQRSRETKENQEIFKDQPEANFDEEFEFNTNLSVEKTGKLKSKMVQLWVGSDKANGKLGDSMFDITSVKDETRIDLTNTKFKNAFVLVSLQIFHGGNFVHNNKIDPSKIQT